MATGLTNLPTIVQNTHFPKFIATDAIRTARLFVSGRVPISSTATASLVSLRSESQRHGLYL